MKAAVFVSVLLGLLACAASDLRAQIYGPYWDAQRQQYLHYLEWQQYLDHLRRVDPYYELYLVHDQLYLAPYQPFYNYCSCCCVPPIRPVASSRWMPRGREVLYGTDAFTDSLKRGWPDRAGA